MTESTIAAGFAKALIELAVSKGASREALIERSKIDLGDLAHQDNRVPLANYLALMEASIEQSGDSALALHFGESFSMPELSIVGLICEAAETPMEAFQQLNRFSQLMVDADDGGGRDWFELNEDAEGMWFSLSNDLYIKHPALVESAFARGMSAAVRAAMPYPRIKEIHFAHDAPNYRSEYERIFQAPLVFSSDKNAVLVEKSSMSAPIGNRASRYVFGVLSDRAEALLDSLKNTKTTKGRVESLLIPLLHTGEVSMERIAALLGLSRPTLYRKLKAEGVNYEKLLDDLRHEMALNYLNEEKTSVNETAYLVGFSDPSAFSRAFKRWTGKSPRALLAQNPTEPSGS